MLSIFNDAVLAVRKLDKIIHRAARRLRTHHRLCLIRIYEAFDKYPDGIYYKSLPFLLQIAASCSPSWSYDDDACRQHIIEIIIIYSESIAH